LIDLLKKYFKKDDPSVEEAQDNGSKILVATCALFLEMANIDREFSEKEKESITNILRKDYSLSEEHIDALMEEAAKELEKSIDMWHFCNLINKNYSKDEKKKIVGLLWKIVFADGHMDQHEEYLTRKLSGILGLSHTEFIAAKLKAKQ